MSIASKWKSTSSDPNLKDAPLLTWKQYRDKYLDACLVLDGRGRHHQCCTSSGCQQSNPTFRCRDCFGLALYCKACIIDHHRNGPLHFLEVWRPHYSDTNLTNNVGVEEWILSKDYIPTFGPARSTRSQAWDLPFPNSGSQKFCRSSCQRHPCARRRLLWLRWGFDSLRTAFGGWMVAINAFGTAIGCIYDCPLVVSHHESPRADIPNRFLPKPRTNDLW